MKTQLKYLRALLDKIPDGPWFEVEGDVRTAFHPEADAIVEAYPHEGGGAASKEIAEWIALLNPKFVRRLVDGPRHVHVVFDATPTEFGEPRILGVFADRAAAVRWMNEEKGKEPVGNQYLEVQRWRVR